MDILKTWGLHVRQAFVRIPHTQIEKGWRIHCRGSHLAPTELFAPDAGLVLVGKVLCVRKPTLNQS